MIDAYSSVVVTGTVYSIDTRSVASRNALDILRLRRLPSALGFARRELPISFRLGFLPFGLPVQILPV